MHARAWIMFATAGLTVLSVRAGPWADAMVALRAGGTVDRTNALAMWSRFPREMDWMFQDRAGVRRKPHDIAEDLQAFAAGRADDPAFAAQLVQAAGGTGADLPAYEAACAKRATERLANARRLAPKIVFVKRQPEKPSFFGYTEGQPGAALCLLDLAADPPAVTTLLDDPTGVIRDAEVSWDGQRVLFAWKKSHRQDDYHLYEMEVATRAIRQLTRGEGVADYEGRYLPDGGIVFASTRCVQTVDCFWTEVSNLYRCDADGSHIRRLGYDQVHTIYPAVLDSGLIVYTRWDYNDRGQVFPQGLFQMRPDGTGQTEFYGNNSWFPTTTSHVRGIPGDNRIVAVLMGHHTWQAGKLALIDVSRGRQENAGVQLIAPERETPAVKVDAYGQDEELFRHPWPLSADEFIVAVAPNPRAREENSRFNLCWVHRDGRREVLVADPAVSCAHPVALAARAKPPVVPAAVDFRKDTGTYYVQDVYTGPSVAGVARGSLAKLRVVALEFRAAGVGHNGSHGEAGGALSSTPVSIGNGCWDAKVVLGETPVLPDGSVFFKAPARTPLYFQLVDTNGCVAQTMRSWSTLMPGENATCVGCHEDKNAAPPPYRTSLALQKGAVELQPFHGIAGRGFSYPRDVQPILDRQCVRCHEQPTRDPKGGGENCGPLVASTYEDKGAKRNWMLSYLTLTGAKAVERASGDCNAALVNWIDAQSRPAPLPPYFKGAAKSRLITLLREGHKDVKLSEAERDTLAAWIDLGVPYCGDYREAHAWTPAEMAKYDRYEQKRLEYAAQERAVREELAAQPRR